MHPALRPQAGSGRDARGPQVHLGCVPTNPQSSCGCGVRGGNRGKRWRKYLSATPAVIGIGPPGLGTSSLRSVTRRIFTNGRSRAARPKVRIVRGPVPHICRISRYSRARRGVSHTPDKGIARVLNSLLRPRKSGGQAATAPHLISNVLP